MRRLCFHRCLSVRGGCLCPHGWVSVRGGPCQGNPLSPLQLRAGGMHPTGMHTSLLCERLGKFKGQVRVFQKCNIPEAAAFYFSFFGGGRGGGEGAKGVRRRHQRDLPLRPASNWWTTRVTKEAIGSGSVVKTKMCCALDWKLVAEKNSLKIPTATSTKLPN